MNKITKAELARMFDVNQSRINALLDSKKIVETADGKIDLDNRVNRQYIELRKETVPKYTGLPTSETTIDDEQDEVSASEDKFSDPLYRSKLLKQEKELELLEIKLAKEKKELIDTEVLSKILLRSYEYFYSLLMEAPYNIIDDLRNIILLRKSDSIADLELLLNTNKDIYNKGLEETRKAIKDLYDSN